MQLRLQQRITRVHACRTIGDNHYTNRSFRRIQPAKYQSDTNRANRNSQSNNNQPNSNNQSNQSRTSVCCLLTILLFPILLCVYFFSSCVFTEVAAVTTTYEQHIKYFNATDNETVISSSFNIDSFFALDDFTCNDNISEDRKTFGKSNWFNHYHHPVSYSAKSLKQLTNIFRKLQLVDYENCNVITKMVMSSNKKETWIANQKAIDNIFAIANKNVPKIYLGISPPRYGQLTTVTYNENKDELIITKRSKGNNIGTVTAILSYCKEKKCVAITIKITRYEYIFSLISM